MFVSIPEDDIFQAGLSNIKNIINLFKYIYANERRDMKMRCLRLLNSEDFISNSPAIWQKISKK
jgi:hypothetical protein